MKIETKYSVGDDVYAIRQKKSSDVWVLLPIVLKSLIVVVLENNRTIISYSDGFIRYPQADIFRTRAEALAECKQRNEVPE